MISERSVSTMWLTLFVCVGMLFIPVMILSQVSPEEIGTAVQHSKTGKLNIRDATILAGAGAVEALPALEASYKQAENDDDRRILASALVRLRDPDDRYWKSLRDQVSVTLNDDIPDSNFSVSQNKMVLHSPELQAWANAHNVSFETASYDARIEYPARILSLANTGDGRAITLLRKSLGSRNFLIAAFAAKGLALLSDESSIHQIISNAGRAPEQYRSLVAQALVYFDTEQAQRAANQLMATSEVEAERQARRSGKRALGYE